MTRQSILQVVPKRADTADPVAQLTSEQRRRYEYLKQFGYSESFCLNVAKGRDDRERYS